MHFGDTLCTDSRILRAVLSVSQTGGKCSNQGEYRPHTDCSKYLLCNNGDYLVMSCAAGLHWDPKRDICDYAENVECGSHKLVCFANKHYT